MVGIFFFLAEGVILKRTEASFRVRLSAERCGERERDSSKVDFKKPHGRQDIT
jgi:hypothetical protein